jgi:hypothetical protein
LSAAQADPALIDHSGIRRFHRSGDTCFLLQRNDKNKSNTGSEVIGLMAEVVQSHCLGAAKDDLCAHHRRRWAKQMSPRFLDRRPPDQAEPDHA